MQHLYFFALPLGLLATGALVYAFQHFATQKGDRQLSAFTTQLLEQVTFETRRDILACQQRRDLLPIADAWSLYSNSRRNLVRAHRLLVFDETSEIDCWMSQAEATHSELKKTVAFAALESFLGGVLRVPFPLSTQAALGLYADEQWIVTEMMQRRLEILEQRVGGAQ